MFENLNYPISGITLAVYMYSAFEIENKHLSSNMQNLQMRIKIMVNYISLTK